MKSSRYTAIARILLGFIFVAGPIATALNVAPQPALPPDAARFMEALARIGYMLPLLWATEIAAGILFLTGRCVPLALLLLAPVMVNIAAFHAFLAPTGVAPALVAIGLEAFLAWQCRAAFAPLFRSLEPEGSTESQRHIRAA